MRSRQVTAIVFTAGMLFLAGCNGSSPTAPDNGGPGTPLVSFTQTNVILISGNGQTGQVDTPLNNPLVVRVVDELGQPLADRDVIWGLIEGEGELTGNPLAVDGVPTARNVTTSGADGLAEVRLTLGDVPGRHLVQAEGFLGGGTVVFEATAAPI